MKPAPRPNASHEVPILLVLPSRASVGTAMREILADRDVRQIAWPPLWSFEDAGIDLCNASPNIRSLDFDALDEVVGALGRACDQAALARLVARRWREVEERVRDWYLQRGVMRTMAGAFRMGPPTVSLPPPPAFVRDRIFEHPLRIEYRLLREGESTPPRLAPAEEATLVWHPFDPSGHASRLEHGLEPGDGPLLECFAYQAGRARHRVLFDRVAAAGAGRQVHDPLE